MPVIGYDHLYSLGQDYRYIEKNLYKDTSNTTENFGEKNFLENIQV